MMRFAAFKDLTRIEQTLFALPYVLAGATLATSHPLAGERPLAWLLILPAFLLARISGMAFNQLIDRHIDARNPRTEKRAIPTGRVTLTQARFVAWGAWILFLLLCMQINTLTAILSAFAALLLYIYSYMKRIHPSCHFFLGLIHFLAPLMAYSALTGCFSPASFFLGAAACFSVISTDIAYAIQDYEYDCKNRLFSIPSQYGIRRSLIISARIHFLTPLMLLAVGLSSGFPRLYYLILPLIAAIIFLFHYKLRNQLSSERPLKEIEPLFFFCNVAISFSSLLFIITSQLWPDIL